jgi:hypothetical protein
VVNVRGVANAATRAINPNVTAELWKSTGSTANPDLSRTPTYRKLPVVLQVQSLTYSDLMQLDGLNIQGVRRAVYANTQVAAIIRVLQKGGDLIVFPQGVMPEGTTWLAAHVLERWPDWNKIALTLQEDNLEAFACE